MKNHIYSKSYGIVLHFCLLILFGFLPFVFSDSLLETETTFRFLISGVVLSVLFLFILIRVSAGSDVQAPAFRQNPFYKFLLLLLIVLAFSILRSFNRGEAIYDFLKVCTAVSYFFFFVFMLKNVENAVSLLLKYVNVAILLFTLIALSQIGLQLKHTNKIRFDFLLSSSLGNKNFYTETMTLLLPLVLMAAMTLGKKWKILSILNVCIILITLVVLQTLSTWVAIIVFIVFIALMLFIFDRQSMQSSASRKKLLVIPGVLAALLIVIALLYQRDHFDLIKTRLGKISTYAQSDDVLKTEDQFHTNSVAERMFLWKNAWHMFTDHPVTGVGSGNWKVYSPKYELPYSKFATDNSIRYMRPHNDLLMILAETGVVGFIFFIGLFACACLLSYRLLRIPVTGDRKTITLLALSGLVIYLTIACFSLPGDRFYTQVLLFLFFALLCSQYELAMPVQTTTTNLRIMTLICLLSITAGISVSYIAAKRYASEIHLIYALQAQSKKNWQKMSYHAGMAKSYWFPMDYTGTPIPWYQGMAAFNSESPAVSKYYFEEALRSNPYDLHVLNDLATAVQREGDNPKAAKLYDEVLSMTPFFTSAYMNKVVMMYNQGDRDKAYEYLHKYPVHRAQYNDVLKGMLIIRTKAAIPDSTVYKWVFMKKDIVAMDSIAGSRHLTFEQLLLQDSLVRALSK
ncbi:MAG: hypothetical protein JWO03_3481 [Bacteroidetes bacterium]|nr:hypothetical protein [Bacteroidota bacterium]